MNLVAIDDSSGAPVLAIEGQYSEGDIARGRYRTLLHDYRMFCLRPTMGNDGSRSWCSAVAYILELLCSIMFMKPCTGFVELMLEFFLWMRERYFPFFSGSVWLAQYFLNS